MKKLIILILFATSLSGYSQIGINTTLPASTLDITATNPTGTTTNVDGILVPRVTRQRAQSMTSVPTSTMVYIYEVATGTATGTTANVTSVGFYFYDGSVWQRIGTGGSSDWTLTGNGGTIPATNYIGTSDPADLSIATNGVEKIRVSTTGQIGIGTPSPNSSALLDVTATNKGVSFPNINLSSETDAATITTPKPGLMVYNTNSTMPCGAGLYFNNGTAAAPLWSCFTKTIKQYHAYNTAARAGVTSATPALQPGCTINFTIPTGQIADIKIDGVLGGLNTSTVAGRVALFDAIVVVDGAALPQGGWNRTTLVNSSAGGNSLGVCTFSTAWVGVTAGAHTIQLFSSRVSGTTSLDIGGNCVLDTNCGEIHATISYR
ncbi:hypothetical protein [Flavobacterium sp. 25HG05S-40]|uniref:hypothetical protein n=1 Tax=Flavobacterium sp. 25HG05S-40 TaxID=3458682 RepID=UPI0040442C46